MKRVFVWTLSLLFGSVTLLGQLRSPSSEQLDSWQTLLARASGSWAIKWNEKTAIPRLFYGGALRLSMSQGVSLDHRLRDFFIEYRQLFGFDSIASQMKLVRDKENRGTHHVVYQQRYRGIEVFRHEYRLTVNKNDELTYVSGDFDPFVAVSSIAPSISQDDASQRALASVSLDAGQARRLEKRLVIYREEETYILAYVVTLVSMYPPGDWVILIDATNGRLLQKVNQVVDVNGSGNAYTSHPGNGSPTQKSLSFLGTSGYLNGTYVRTDNEDGADAYSSAYEYFYDSSNQNFDEVNVYYHVTRMQYDFFKALDPSYNPVQRAAIVHYGTNLNNAYATSSGDLWFGDGDGVNYLDFAKEESIVYHENSHVVIFEANDLGTDLYSQARAMHEGFSDYFAASHSIASTDYVIGEWVVPGSGYIRSLESNATWNGSFSQDWDGSGSINAYDYALVWAGALWDCQQTPYNIPRAVMDWVAYDGLYDLSSNATFSEALVAIINSDMSTYSGSHVNSIRSAFNARGIYEPLSVSISGPDYVMSKQWFTWTANVSGGSGNVSYQWYKDAQTLGTSQQQSAFSGMTSFTMRCDVHDNGTGENASASLYVVNDAEGSIAAPNSVDAIAVPTQFSVGQNYPNPFNPETQISFALPEPADVSVSISDLLGREVVRLTSARYSAGYHSVRWLGTDASGSKVGSGIYFYRINAIGEGGKRYSKVMKMLLAK